MTIRDSVLANYASDQNIKRHIVIARLTRCFPVTQVDMVHTQSPNRLPAWFLTHGAGMIPPYTITLHLKEVTFEMQCEGFCTWQILCLTIGTVEN